MAIVVDTHTILHRGLGAPIANPGLEDKLPWARSKLQFHLAYVKISGSTDIVDMAANADTIMYARKNA